MRTGEFNYRVCVSMWVYRSSEQICNHKAGKKEIVVVSIVNWFSGLISFSQGLTTS